MSTENTCLSCGAKIKSGILGTNTLYGEMEFSLIDEILGKNVTAGCSKCLGEVFMDTLIAFRKKREEMNESIKKAMSHIPIVTSHSPLGWEYKTIGMVTGQSTTGTGLFSEISSSWTDFLGVQSHAYNKKIFEGEAMCAQQLQAKTVQMGGNAIVAADIDYAEMGGGKGMIMVCMSGTAVTLSNLEVLPGAIIQELKNITPLVNKIAEWNVKYEKIIKLNM